MPLVPVGVPAREVAELIGRRRAASTAVLRGPARAPWLAAFEDALPRRRSVREFADRSVDATALRAALHDGYRTEALLWPPEAHGEVDVVALVAAFAVDGMAPGLHAVPPPDSHRPEAYLGQREWLPELRGEYAAAPAIAMICGDARAVEHGQGTGYGTLLARAAGIGYAAWLSAVRTGLAGAVFGGARHPVTATVRQFHPGLRHLFTVVIGHERG